MLFKIFTIGTLLYILYKITFPVKQINSTGKEKIVPPKRKKKKINDDDYIEYEEIDE